MGACLTTQGQLGFFTGSRSVCTDGKSYESVGVAPVPGLSAGVEITAVIANEPGTTVGDVMTGPSVTAQGDIGPVAASASWSPGDDGGETVGIGVGAASRCPSRG